MLLEVRGAHFLIRSAQLVQGTRLEWALGERFLSRFKALYKIFPSSSFVYICGIFLHFTDDDVDERCIRCVQWCIHDGLDGSENLFTRMLMGVKTLPMT